jgi:hypothetical protein
MQFFAQRVESGRVCSETRNRLFAECLIALISST